VLVHAFVGTTYQYDDNEKEITDKWLKCRDRR
jgi:hypothetical protein